MEKTIFSYTSFSACTVSASNFVITVNPLSPRYLDLNSPNLP